MSAQNSDVWNPQQEHLPNPLSLNESSIPRHAGRQTKQPPNPVVPEDPGMQKGVSIGVKATLLATVFGVVPVLIVGGVAYQSADGSITRQIAQEKIAEAGQLSDQVSRYLQERIANVKTLASIAAALTRDGGLASLTENTDSGDIARSTLADELTTFVQDYRTYANIALYNLQGDVVVQSEGSARELNQRDALYFQQVLETGLPSVSEPIASDGSSEAQRLAVYVAAPVQNAAGQTTAVMAAKIPVEFIGNAVLRTTSARQGQAYRLVSSSGEIFQNLPTDEQMAMGTPVAEMMSLYSTVNEQRQPQAWLEDGIANPELNAYAPVTGIDRLEWSVVTSTDSTVAFIPQQQLLRAIGLGTVLTALMAAVVGALLARRITFPIQRVASTVEKLGQGELDTRVAVKGNDELAVLGSTVNQMASQMQNLLQTVSENAERLTHQSDVLSTLARNEALMQGDSYGVARAFTEAIAQTLNVERVSIWVYSDDRTSLTCLSQYHQSGASYSEGDRLSSIEAALYFENLHDVIAADNVRSHLATSALMAAGLVPPDTESLLSIPIQIAGQTAGVIRCEHVQTIRIWQASERSFVSSIANLVSIAIESEFLQQEVSHLLDVVSDVEEGDLTTQARVSDRSTGLVADTFNRLIERLTDVMARVINVAQQVSDGANQQKSMAEIVATNTEQQAQAVSQVLQLTEDVEQMAQDSAEQARATTRSLQAMSQTVEQGQGAIATLMQGINVLQEGTNRIVQQMKTLGEFVGLADQFVQDQSQIASLTQTLALNASLVAARASEQRDPRQFAVVAREFDSIASQVGRLAQQTNEGLVTLEQRSTQIHSVVSIIDANIQNLGGLVRGFTQGVDQSDRVFSGVQTVTADAVVAGEAVTQSSQMIVSVSQSAAQVVRDISNFAIQTADLSQQTRQQSDEMDTLSNQLLQSIEFFRLPSISSVAASPSRIDLSDADAPTLEVSLETTSPDLTLEAFAHLADDSDGSAQNGGAQDDSVDNNSDQNDSSPDDSSPDDSVLDDSAQDAISETDETKATAMVVSGFADAMPLTDLSDLRIETNSRSLPEP